METDNPNQRVITHINYLALPVAIEKLWNPPEKPQTRRILSAVPTGILVGTDPQIAVGLEYVTLEPNTLDAA